MSDFTVSRPGLVAGGADNTAIFLKVFAGEVLTAFETQVILKSLTRQRAIASGKSAQFPMIWKAATAYHTPGVELDGQSIKSSEKVITIDDLLTSTVFVADIDEAMSHFDVRGPYSTEMGRALALAYDKNVNRALLLSARSGAQIDGEAASAGAYLQDADGATSGTSLADSIIDAKRTLEEKDVPVESMQVNAIVRPTLWYLLSKETTKVMNRDIGSGDWSRGIVPLVGGVKVYKSNAFVFGTNDASNTDIPAKYRGTWTNALSVVFVEPAAATVQLLGLGMETERSVRHQGTFMVGKYAVGHDLLLARCAVEIGTGATAG